MITREIINARELLGIIVFLTIAYSILFGIGWALRPKSQLPTAEKPE